MVRATNLVNVRVAPLLRSLCLGLFRVIRFACSLLLAALLMT